MMEEEQTEAEQLRVLRELLLRELAPKERESAFSLECAILELNRITGEV